MREIAGHDPRIRPGLERPALAAVLESAARLQQVVPDAVLVGGSAATLYADHRDSYDHDHVLADLSERFDAVLEAVESTEGWVTNRVQAGKIILGELGGIETGLRQLIRATPLEVAEIHLPSGQVLRVPTAEETLRVKAYLIVQRNQVRDYLDVVALADRHGIAHAASALSRIDDFYPDSTDPSGARVASQVARQLADPRPKDQVTTKQLAHYKGLDARWHDWATVRRASQAIACEMTRGH